MGHQIAPKLAVIIPWFDSGDPIRQKALDFVIKNVESWGIAEIFIGTHNTLNRAALRNDGARKAIAKGHTKLFFNDADSLITKGQLTAAINLLDDAEGVVYPYNRMPVHLNEEETNYVYGGGDFNKFANLFTREIIPGAGNFCCDSNTFDMLGGLDEAFIGYGYEDSDFVFSAYRNIRRARTVDGSLIELYHPATKQRGTETGPVTVKDSPDYNLFERNKTRFYTKLKFGLAEWRGMANKPLLDIVVPVMRHNMAERFMANTVFPVTAVTYNDEALGVEWTKAGATVIESPGSTFAQKCNYAFKQLNGEYTLFVGEDVEFFPYWYEPLPKYFGVYQVIGTNDLLYANELRSSHLIFSRPYVETSGGSWETRGNPFYEYKHNFPDTEAIAKARQLKVWGYGPDIIIKHEHPENGGVANDKVYDLGKASFNEDRNTYIERYTKYCY